MSMNDGGLDAANWKYRLANWDSQFFREDDADKALEEIERLTRENDALREVISQVCPSFRWDLFRKDFDL